MSAYFAHNINIDINNNMKVHLNEHRLKWWCPILCTPFNNRSVIPPIACCRNGGIRFGAHDMIIIIFAKIAKRPPRSRNTEDVCGETRKLYAHTAGQISLNPHARNTSAEETTTTTRRKETVMLGTVALVVAVDGSLRRCWRYHVVYNERTKSPAKKTLLISNKGSIIFDLSRGVRACGAYGVHTLLNVV